MRGVISQVAPAAANADAGHEGLPMGFRDARPSRRQGEARAEALPRGAHLLETPMVLTAMLTITMYPGATT
jgi:hypothetical protein